MFTVFKDENVNNKADDGDESDSELEQDMQNLIANYKNSDQAEENLKTLERIQKRMKNCKSIELNKKFQKQSFKFQMIQKHLFGHVAAREFQKTQSKLNKRD